MVWLAAALAVCCAAAVTALARDPAVVARVRMLASGHRDGRLKPTLARGDEPPPGFVLPATTVRGKFDAVLSGGRRGTMVVTLGNCGGCFRFEPAPWRTAARQRGLGVVGVADAGEEAVGRYVREARPGFPVVADPKALVSAALKSTYAGRIYVFDREWRLVWRTEIGSDLVEFRDHLAGLDSAWSERAVHVGPPAVSPPARATDNRTERSAP